MVSAINKTRRMMYVKETTPGGVSKENTLKR